MEALRHAIEWTTSTEVLNLQDAWLPEQATKILTKSAKRKVKRKLSKERRMKMHWSSKVEKNKDCNIEHLICKTRWWVNNILNYKTSRRTAHAGKHAYLWVQLPHEQFMTIMDDNFQVFCEETREMIREEIEQILEFYLKHWELYNEKCFVHRSKIPTKL